MLYILDQLKKVETLENKDGFRNALKRAVETFFLKQQLRFLPENFFGGIPTWFSILSPIQKDINVYNIGNIEDFGLFLKRKHFLSALASMKIEALPSLQIREWNTRKHFTIEVLKDEQDHELKEGSAERVIKLSFKTLKRDPFTLNEDYEIILSLNKFSALSEKFPLNTLIIIKDNVILKIDINAYYRFLSEELSELKKEFPPNKGINEYFDYKKLGVESLEDLVRLLPSNLKTKYRIPLSSIAAFYLMDSNNEPALWTHILKTGMMYQSVKLEEKGYYQKVSDFGSYEITRIVLAAYKTFFGNLPEDFIVRVNKS